MTRTAGIFTFTHIRGSQWHVTVAGAHFAYVSTAAVIRVIKEA